GDGASRDYAEEVWKMLCHLRVGQERMARRVSQLECCFRKALPLVHRAASYGASRTFNVHHARRTEQMAQRADAKSIYSKAIFRFK
ncbi:hypothetical protein A2U01_0064316, partial [Trifolium medium]|nr:hypothetical protein [Trifolium medium]